MWKSQIERRAHQRGVRVNFKKCLIAEQVEPTRDVKCLSHCSSPSTRYSGLCLLLLALSLRSSSYFHNHFLVHFIALTEQAVNGHFASEQVGHKQHGVLSPADRSLSFSPWLRVWIPMELGKCPGQARNTLLAGARHCRENSVMLNRS